MLKNSSLIATLALCIILSSSEAFAFIPFFNEDTKPNTLEVGLTGGYFRLSPDNRVYATKLSTVGSAFDTDVLKINPSFRSGGGVDVIYGSSYKLNAIYFETDNKKTQTNTGLMGVSLTPPVWAVTSATNVSSSLDSKYKFATVSVSNPFTLSCFTITPSVGFSYLFLRHNQSAVYGNATVNAVPGQTAEVQLNSRFWGIGPTFAANFGYEFCGGYSVIGAIQYSPLIGDIRGNYFARNSNPIAAGTNINLNLAFKTQSTIVNHAQSEVGFAYSVPVNKCVTGNISLVYRLVKIIGARETNSFVDNVSPSLINNQISNSVLHGPLLRVALKFKIS